MPAIKTVQVIEHFTNVELGKSGRSFGQMIDEEIEKALSSDKCCQEFSVLIDREDWLKMQRDYTNLGQTKPKAR